MAWKKIITADSTDKVTLTSATQNVLLATNPTDDNWGGIQFQYGGAVKGYSVFNSGNMVYGGESGTGTIIQANGATALDFDSSSPYNATFAGNVSLDKDDGTIYLNNAGTGNSGVYIRGNSDDTMRSLVPAGKFFEWEVGGTQKLKLDTTTATFAGNITSTGTGANAFSGDIDIAGANYLYLGGYVRLRNSQSPHSLKTQIYNNSTWNDAVNIANDSSATFAGNVSIDKADGQLILANGSGTTRAYLQYQESGNDLVISSNEAGSDITFLPAGNTALTLADDLSATFAGKILASDAIKTAKDLNVGSLDGTFTQRNNWINMYCGSAGYQNTIIFNKYPIGAQFAIKGMQHDWELGCLRAGGNISFRTSTANDDWTEALRIDDSQNSTFSGNVAIAPTKKLYFDGAGGNTYIQETQEDYVSFYVNQKTAIRLTENGQVGLAGTNNPFYALVAAPYSGAYGSFYAAGTTTGTHLNLQAVYRPSLGGGRPTVGGRGSEPGWEFYHDTSSDEAVAGLRIGGFSGERRIQYYYAGADLIFGTVTSATADSALTPRFTLGEDGVATFAGTLASGNISVTGTLSTTASAYIGDNLQMTGGQFYINGGSSNDSTWRIYRNGTSLQFGNRTSGSWDDNRFVLNAVGNATFAGELTCGDEFTVEDGATKVTIDHDQTGLSQYSAGEPTRIRFKRSRGTNASPTAVADTDVIGQLIFSPYAPTSSNNLGFRQASSITSTITGAISAGVMKSDLKFYTTTVPTGNNLALTLGSDLSATFAGEVGIGTESPSSYYYDDLVVYTGDEGGITIASSTTSGAQYLAFADGTSGDDMFRGFIQYDHNNNNMSFAVNATEALRFDSSQNSTFAGHVTVGSTSRSEHSYTYYKNTNTPSAGWTVGAQNGGRFQITEQGVADQFMIAEGGNATFAGNVEVSKSSQPHLQIQQTSGNAWRWYTSGTDSFIRNATGGHNILSLEADGDIGFYNSDGSATPFFWDASALSLGIGTTAPQASLHVESDLRHAWDNNETDLLKVGQAGTDTGFVVWASGGTGEVYLGNLYNNDAGDINFVTKASVDDSNVKMKIQGDGKVGIGTTSPLGKLEISGDSGAYNSAHVDYNAHLFLTNDQDTDLDAVGITFHLHNTLPKNKGCAIVAQRQNSTASDLIFKTTRASVTHESLKLSNAQALFTGDVQADGFKSSDGSAGITTTKTWEDGSAETHTVTIKDGLITAWTIVT